ncbi:MAG: carbon-nitrogen hydrolase family protein [Candidatus Lokiarchaeota archaeon]|nr:carbon-nitrogen hydrolase family protein [Candidatus Lokiarchaeota archaeon]
MEYLKIKISVVQFQRDGKFKQNIEKIDTLLGNIKDSDFILLGGEFSINESSRENPYPAIKKLSQKYDANIVAPVNANLERFPNLKSKGRSSIQIIDRKGKVIAIQDKQHFYFKERAWFMKGSKIQVFEVEGIKIGLIRGLDLFYPEYTRKLMDAELCFVSTMAVDNMMLELAKIRALENISYFVMSSFIGQFVGMDFIGNAAIIEPQAIIKKGMRFQNQVKTLVHSQDEGFYETEIDIAHIRKLKGIFPYEETNY